MLYDFTLDGSMFRCESDCETAAKTKAEEHFKNAYATFGQDLPTGRWVESDEGEDDKGAVVYILFRYETPIFLASFLSYMYPEDNKVLGLFSTAKKAEDEIQRNIDYDKSAHPNHPRRYQQNKSYYSVDEFYLDDLN